MSNLKIAVFAGSQFQYEKFLKNHVMKEERDKYVFATMENIRGINFFTFIKYGNYFRMEGYTLVMNEVLANIYLQK